jgi:hypothetical protein
MNKQNRLTSIQTFVNTFVNDLKERAPRNTGDLQNSIVGNIENVGENLEIQIDAANYATFQNFGVNGSENDYGSPYSFRRLPNIGAFEGIANQLGTSPWAIAKSVFRKGIRPTFFATNNLDNTLQRFGDDYAEATWEDFYEDNKDEKQN